MLPITAIGAALLAFATGSYAQNYTQSANFTLWLSSEDPVYNATFLVACHIGAASESLCPYSTLPKPSGVTDGTPSKFQFNTTSYSDASSGMSISYNPTSNVAVPYFNPGHGNAVVAFDSNNYLNVPAYNSTDRSYYPQYHWYVCEKVDFNYGWTELVWVIGPGAPDRYTNCCPVGVVRVFS
ncbi:hypothetical protein LTR56_015284 [Elasticomyces elasticus]|nr:hypothetical protein LTR56_015284 [Elasticomyces elasticus]KAK3640382.1 hypothetical protein LTR22_017039 [Elasticomyces elasticus]KAK4913632.1 hypothetical protein LTR49_018046 [Elasticomyces elasticus]KAK5753059.1 hypothetical protein LTS12_016839 [Elasticomyces elasticus]